MEIDETTWFILKVTVVATIASAGLQVALASGFSSLLVAQTMLAVAAGLGCLSLSRIWLRRRHITPFAALGGRKVIRAVAIGIGCLMTVVALWLSTNRLLSAIQDSGAEATPKVVQSPSTPIERATMLAARLTAGSWAMEGESCERDRIRFRVEGDQLVGELLDAEPIRYRLMNAAASKLSTLLNGRQIDFEIEETGFAHVDRGQMQWFRRCG